MRSLAAPSARQPSSRAVAAYFAVLVALPVLMLGIDRPIALWVDGLGDAWPVVVGRAVTDLGKAVWYLVPLGVVVLALAPVRIAMRGRRHAALVAWIWWAAVFLFCALALSGLLVNLIKLLYGRARPGVLEETGFYGMVPLTFDSDYASFPSGHAQTLFALAAGLGLFWRRARVPLLVACGLLALSRVAVGAHYISDVLAGALLGVLWVYWQRDWFAARRLVWRRTPSCACRCRLGSGVWRHLLRRLGRKPGNPPRRARPGCGPARPGAGPVASLRPLTPGRAGRR